MRRHIGRNEFGQVSYCIDENGFARWYNYDACGNKILYCNSNGFKSWYEYDAYGNMTHYKDTNGFECWRECDEYGNETYYRNNLGYERGTRLQSIISRRTKNAKEITI